MSPNALGKLIQELETISEKYWSAHWRTGIEFFAWDRVTGLDLLPQGNLPLTTSEIDILRRLSREIGGWAVLLPNGDTRFVPDIKWHALHLRYRSGEDIESVLQSLVQL